MYSEDSKASVDSGGAQDSKKETSTTTTHPDISAGLASITRGADPEKQRRARRMTKKGMKVNPDYL